MLKNSSYNVPKSIKELKQVGEKIPEYIKTTQNKQKINHDKIHQLITYEPNQLVLIKFPFQEQSKTQKLAPK